MYKRFVQAFSWNDYLIIFIKLYRDPLIYLTFKLLVNGEREQEVSNNDDFLSVIEMLILLKLES